MRKSLTLFFRDIPLNNSSIIRTSDIYSRNVFNIDNDIDGIEIYGVWEKSNKRIEIIAGNFFSSDE